MTERRKLKRGMILLNLWAGWQTLFIYFGTSGRMAYGISLTRINGKNRIRKATYYLTSLQEEERYPCVGFIDIQAMWERTVADGLTDREIIKKNYGADGHTIRATDKE